MERYLQSSRTFPGATPAETEIRRRISADGPMTFADFMGIALYWPDGGYYTSGAAFGADGDFYTAPLTHPVFGALVAKQVEEMWRAAGTPERWWVVEPGAGLGQLAADVLAAVGDGESASALRYLAVDRSRPRQPVAGMSWAQSLALPVRGLRGVVLANELFDAMPVHRVTVVDGALREMFVGLDDDGRFVDVLGAASVGIAERLDGLGVTLAEGHRAEVCLELDAWMAGVGLAMDSGYLLLVDYGHDATAYYNSTRHRGLLRTYYKHTLGMDPYAHVGRQDISVHVELTSLRQAAVAAGFTEAGATTQAEFLRSLGFDAYRADIASRRDLPTPVRVANLRALDTLVDPEGMGAFRVLAFAKGVPADGLSGFSGMEPELSVTAPLATGFHMPLGGAPGDATEVVEMPSWDELLK
ncbi:MAG: SAM-dependent methyltransferase [Chloroflexi bacterium]|nr:SAM-dependent methyltransferase [Chloroflexota bacterium]MDA1173807.1 SAM-dependent methyltransferase [Chloroflexota bacterium]